MTSLTSQLLSLTRPQTLNLERNKKRPSLLFNPNEASGLRKDAVFEIGLSGIQELILKNHEFEKFLNTLFSIAGKDVERSVQSAECNRKIDKHVRKFLLLLSPYFLLNCSYKALEWLIYRYSIHEYNREDFLMLIFPYHETNIFVKVIQILKFGNVKDPWNFLIPIQKTGVHLPKQTIFNHAASSPYFIKFVSSYILDVIKVTKNTSRLSIAFNYYSTIFIGAIVNSHEISEPVITQMLPVLKKGLNSDLSDFRAASYVIAANILTKCTLEHNIIDEFMQNISDHKIDSMKDETCLLYIVIYQTQEGYNHMASDTFEEIATQHWLPKTLQGLNKEGYLIYPFLEVLIKCAIMNGIEEDGLHYRQFLFKLLNELKIDETHVSICMRVILDSLPKQLKKRPAEVLTWLTEVIELFEKQYPTQFDMEVYQILSSSDIRKEKLHEILQNTIKLQKKFYIFDKINHPNSLIRKKAVKFISKNYDSFEEEDWDILRISLENRLKDENIEVVREALIAADKVKFLDEHKMNEIVMELLDKFYREESKWKSVLPNILQFLCREKNCHNFKVILNIFPLLLSTCSEESIYVKQIINSDLFSNCSLFDNFKTHNFNDTSDLQNQIFEALNASKNKAIMLEFFDQINELNFNTLSPLQIYSSLLIVSNIDSKYWSIQDILPLLEIFVKFFGSYSSKSYKMKKSIGDNFALCKKGKLPVSGFLECIVKLVPNPENIQTKNIDFSTSANTSRFLILITSILYLKNDTHAPYRHYFHQFLFKNIRAKINFILHLAVYMQLKNDDFQKDILSIALKEIELDGQNGEHINLKHEIISFLLILMTCPQRGIRKKTFKLTENIIGLVSEKKISYKLFFNQLFNDQEAIVLDCDHVPVAVSKSLAFQEDLLDQLIELCCDSKLPTYLAAGLLEVLSQINTAKVFENTSVRAYEILCRNNEEYDEFESKIILKNIQRFNEEIGQDLKRDTNILKYLVSVLKNDKHCLSLSQTKTSPFLLLLGHTDIEKFMISLPKEIKKTVFDLIVDITTTSADPKVFLASNKLFRHTDIDVDLILPHLAKMKNIQVNISKKNQKIEAIPTIDILDTAEWKRGMRILELIQNKKKLSNAMALLPVLFDILSRCLDFCEQAVLEYPKQLILSLILHLCQILGDRKIPENYFNIESIVQCIRRSTNPQTHHHALLVLEHCTSLIPTQVLHHIMPIFTFMGSSVLRHDDTYSFQLITSIIDTVIPLLINDCNTETIISILQVFVDALLYIPEHRRVTLYTYLLQKINPKDYLYIFVLLVIHSHVSHTSRGKTSVLKNKFEDDSTFNRLDVATTIAREFSTDDIFSCIIDLMKYLKQLPVEQDNCEESVQPNIGLKDITAKQYRHFKYSVLLFINRFISSPEFINRIAKLPSEHLASTESFCKDIVVGILSFIQSTSVLVEKNQTGGQAQYWKAIHFQSLEVLDGINTLLTPDMFLVVTKGLLTHNSSVVKKRILDLLNTKLMRSTTFVEECQQKDVSDIVDALLGTINNLKKDGSEQELMVIQTALLSLKLIIKTIYKKQNEKNLIILDFITNIISSDNAKGNVLASLLLCLAELCVSLRAKSLHCLPHLMPVLMNILKEQKYQITPSLLCLSSLTTLLKIIENLALFISPYLKKLLTEISKLSIIWENSDDNSKFSPFISKLNSIKQKIAETIEPRVLITAVEESYTSLVSKNNIDAICPLMNILKQNLTFMSSAAITANTNTLNKFFMTALEYRCITKSDFERTTVVENEIIEAFLALVLKLSETSFRPLYYKIFDWAIRTDFKNDRIITFYNLSCALVKHLKSLFILFADLFINNAGQILDACNTTKTQTLYFDDIPKNVILLEKILETLYNVFKYTTIKFINKEHFNALMQPLVDNLENDLDTIDDLEKRNEKLLTPCIVQLVVATSDDALWKKLNYQILLKMKHNNPRIRLISLMCLSEVVKRLGEDFLPLLPETIPFLSELLEDEDENVEKHCRKAIQEMEIILGENLQKYF